MVSSPQGSSSRRHRDPRTDPRGISDNQVLALQTESEYRMRLESAQRQSELIDVIPHMKALAFRKLAALVSPCGATVCDEILTAYLDAGEKEIADAWYRTKEEFGWLCIDDETYEIDSARRNCTFLARAATAYGVSQAEALSILEQGLPVADFPPISPRWPVGADLFRRIVDHDSIDIILDEVAVA